MDQVDERNDMQEKLAAYAEELESHMQRGEYALAYPAAHRALACARALYDSLDERLAVALNDAAAVERYLGRYDEARDHFSEAARILRICRGETDAEYGTTVNNLAGLYRLTGDLAAAEGAFKRALAIYRASLPEDDWRTVSCYNNMGLLYQDQGGYDEAQACHEHALALLEGSDAGIKHPNSIATSLMNLAVCVWHAGDVARASELFERGRAMTLKLNGHVSASYASALNNVASFYAGTGELERALALLEESRDIARELFGIESRAYALVMRNIAQVREAVHARP